MNSLHILIVFFVGLGLGLHYFGGLWLTVKSLPNVRHPGLLAVGSFFIRMVIVMLGFYVVMDNHWLPLIICVLGFFTMRYILVRRLAV